MALLTGKTALLLDMNGTFMFGEDRFGESEDFSKHYIEINGTLQRSEVNTLVRAAYRYLHIRYPDGSYRLNFPSVETAVRAVVGDGIDGREIEKLVNTFAFHELGSIPKDYADALHDLRRQFVLAAVIDIWSPKTVWLSAFERAGVLHLFSALSFSSDHGMVKPSPEPFENVLDQLGTPRARAVVIGDSPRRDLGGARNAGIDCILVGKAEDPLAMATFENLLELRDRLYET